MWIKYYFRNSLLIIFVSVSYFEVYLAFFVSCLCSLPLSFEFWLFFFWFIDLSYVGFAYWFMFIFVVVYYWMFDMFLLAFLLSFDEFIFCVNHAPFIWFCFVWFLKLFIFFFFFFIIAQKSTLLILKRNKPIRNHCHHGYEFLLSTLSKCIQYIYLAINSKYIVFITKTIYLKSFIIYCTIVFVLRQSQRVMEG